MNSKETLKNNEEYTKNNVKTKQFGAQRRRSKKDDTLKISKLQLRLQLQLQLTAHKTETDSNKLKEASKTSAKKGKRITPARRQFSSGYLFSNLQS